MFMLCFKFLLSQCIPLFRLRGLSGWLLLAKQSTRADTTVSLNCRTPLVSSFPEIVGDYCHRQSSLNYIILAVCLTCSDH
jgi:hypothetical protein